MVSFNPENPAHRNVMAMDLIRTPEPMKLFIITTMYDNNLFSLGIALKLVTKYVRWKDGNKAAQIAFVKFMRMQKARGRDMVSELWTDLLLRMYLNKLTPQQYQMVFSRLVLLGWKAPELPEVVQPVTASVDALVCA